MAVQQLSIERSPTDDFTALPPRASWLASVPLEIREIPASTLNILTKTRSNPFPWKGQFSPQFVQAILERYAEPGMAVCDPFVGSGTVLGEAGRCKIEAIGAEINPAAYHLARMYHFVNVEPADRKPIIHAVSGLLQEAFPQSVPLLDGYTNSQGAQEIAQRLCDLKALQDDNACRALIEALIVLLDVWKPGLDTRRLYATWHALANEVTRLPFSQQRLRVVNCDARSLPINDASVDLVLTSPPYINVLNYHQQYRRSAEMLGWQLLSVARSEIGSNRKNRGNRFLTVVQYCQDVALALNEMRRICRPRGRIVVVLGRESTVRGTRFFNSDIVMRLASRCAGLHVTMRQERVFRNRFGEAIYEDILHLFPELPTTIEPISAATCVATEVLDEARSEAPEGSRSDLEEALAGARAVEPSPVYARQRAEAKKPGGTAAE